MYSIAVYHNGREVVYQELENADSHNDVKYVLSNLLEIDKPEDGFEYAVFRGGKEYWNPTQVLKEMKGFSPTKYLMNPYAEQR